MLARMVGRTLFAAALLFGPGVAQAQIAAEHPRLCVMNVGPTQMMFSAVQNRSDEIFCQRVPETGPATIVLDARQQELRDMNVEVRVLRNVGQTDWRDDVDANTVSVAPAAKYFAKSGSAMFPTKLDKNGSYIALVRATSDDGAREYVGEYDFAVGGFTEWHALFAALSVGVVALFYSLLRARKTPAPAPKPAASAARQTT